MPKKKLTPEQGKKLLEETKERVRLEQQARTETRLRELEIGVLENLERQLLTEPVELVRELNYPETSTARRYTLIASDNEEYLTDEKTSSSVTQSVVEIPD